MSSDLVYAQREIDNLINLLADARTENMKLRAALGEIVAMDEVALIEWKKGDGWLHQRVARAALEEGMTSPDEREDCTGLEDSSTVNPCGHEDCEEEGRT